jgi:undecaprenyl diphosphate synthase
LLNKKLLEKVDMQKLPLHVAIIMDGNGRWAKKRRLPRIAGHRSGVKSVDDVVTTARKLGLKALTLYALSTENLNRPKDEVSGLMELLHEYLIRELERLCRENIRLNTIGDVEHLPLAVQKAIRKVKGETENNSAMVLTLALSYGSRSEIVEAVTEIIKQVKRGELDERDIDEESFSRFLHTAQLPDLDLLIRTGCEKRVSNFMLWQMAYTELYFSDLLWPDFRGNDLLNAIIEYQGRERRFGLTQEQVLSLKR